MGNNFMRNPLVAAWYRPPNVLFLDDNSTFLRNLTLGLETSKITYKTFDDPYNAIEFLKESNSSPLGKNFLSDAPVNTNLNEDIESTLISIQEEIFDPKHFDEVSIFVVDYAMPLCNGLEVCKEIRKLGKPIKLLMLTGEADEKIGVEAFNNGEIDQFIRKDSPDFANLLNSKILDLQKKYYMDISNIILNRLKTNAQISIAPNLYDEEFAKIFNIILKENNIAEYYLIDSYGSFLLLDFNGKAFWLFVKTEEDMAEDYNIAIYADEEFPAALLSAMKNREKILCLYKQSICDDPEEAERFLFPASRLEGQKIYYYALFSDAIPFDFSSQDIISFNTHKKSIE